MPAPEPPSRPKSQSPGTNWLGLLLAAMAGIVIFTALAFLTGGFLGLVLVVGGGVFALAAVHYLVWGWWLSKMLYDEEAAENARREQDEQIQDSHLTGESIENEPHREQRIDRDPHG